MNITPSWSAKREEDTTRRQKKTIVNNGNYKRLRNRGHCAKDLDSVVSSCLIGIRWRRRERVTGSQEESEDRRQPEIVRWSEKEKKAPVDWAFTLCQERESAHVKSLA